ncbi:MAG: protein-L-isoaspartate O-methyltransferase, partial [Anaerolineae bacterium]|nr:protein-L-isoaspartate O-methyltransferase [Anaerolineae bacterium]
MKKKPDFEDLRRRMVQKQIVRRGIRNPDVLASMRAIPRHIFIPEDQRKWAYSDNALRIEEEQTISQPYIVA